MPARATLTVSIVQLVEHTELATEVRASGPAYRTIQSERPGHRPPGQRTVTMYP